MNTFESILVKLEQFIRKYYTNELIKGTILFFAIGLLYLIATLLIEHYLWLSQTGRTLLFWIFVLAETSLFLRFIAFPLAKLFKLQKGIDFAQASKIIGNHFPQVNDKLLNLLQLKENNQESELLLASIEQKSQEMQPIPFVNAVNFKQNLKYLKYAAIPVVIVLIFAVTGNTGIFSSSYERVLNYKTAYEPPAPFTFLVLEDHLNAIENKPFTLHIKVVGSVIPENALINYNGEQYYMQKTGIDSYRYTFERPTEPITFNFSANTVASKPYFLDVVKVPTLLSFQMVMDYPAYINKSSERFESSGNAVVPEGTRITWNLAAKNTNQVAFKTKDSTSFFDHKASIFSHTKRVISKLDYQITTSNTFLNDYENLGYTIQVVKDQNPEIQVTSKQDTINSQITYFFGRISDDYGLSKLQLVYYQSNDENAKTSVIMPVNKNTVDQFLFVFPGQLELEEGKEYSYYFEVFDNDAVNGSKSTRSSSFSFRKLTKDELEKQQLEDQKETIQGMGKSLQELEKQQDQLEELSRIQKEKNELNWNDKKNLEEFLKRQQLQEEMMKKFSEKMKDQLENFQKDNPKQDTQKEQLQKRFEENEDKLKQNEKLLDELQKLQDKLAKEELFDKMEQLSKQNKKQHRNVEQLLELTKRYYVEKKAQKLAEELNKLAEEQESLSQKNDEENTKEKQEELNKKFDSYRKEMEELQKENDGLKKPLTIPDNNAIEEEVKQEQQKATEQLQQQQPQNAKQNQKKAAQKMKEMSMQMQMQMGSGGEQSKEEDIDMLRQIVKNLIIFSMSQEQLMEEFKSSNYGNLLFGKKLVRQNELKQNFQHIDDSLFALALRNPAVGTKINDLIEDVNYNVDKSLEELSENRLRNGVASQQYVMVAANELAILLAEALNMMQMQMMGMMGQGEGKGRGFQLPDIIQQQEGLNEKMEKGLQKGEQGDQSGNEGDGMGGEEGSGKGQNGKEGQDGNGSTDGNSNKEGEGTTPFSEQLNGMLFEIYQQQQLLRMQLQDMLKEQGLPADARDLIRKMENIENELLERGFNEQTLKKMNEIKHQLLKLDKAAFQQGEDEKRQGNTNKTEYRNTIEKQLDNARNYFNNIEILNRHQLPLKQVYKQKVQYYFSTSDD